MTDVPSATCPAVSHGDLTHASCLASKLTDGAVYVYDVASACGVSAAPSGRHGAPWCSAMPFADVEMSRLGRSGPDSGKKGAGLVATAADPLGEDDDEGVERGGDDIAAVIEGLRRENSRLRQRLAMVQRLSSLLA